MPNTDSVNKDRELSGGSAESPRPALEQDSDAPKDAFEIAFDELGMRGAMLSGTKQARPDQNPVWNANVVSATHGKIWYGDLDLANERETGALQRIANRLGAKVYVLRERDARFEFESKPRIENAVATYDPA